MSVEISGVSSGRVPGEGTQPGKNKREFYVPELEGRNNDPTGWPKNYPTVRPLWDAN